MGYLRDIGLTLISSQTRLFFVQGWLPDVRVKIVDFFKPSSRALIRPGSKALGATAHWELGALLLSPAS